MWMFTPSSSSVPSIDGGSQFPGTAMVRMGTRWKRSCAYEGGFPKCVMSPQARNTSGPCARIAAGISSRAWREPWRSVAIRIRIARTSDQAERPEAAEHESEGYQIAGDRPAVEEREPRLRIPLHHELHQDREAGEGPDHRRDCDKQGRWQAEDREVRISVPGLKEDRRGDDEDPGDDDVPEPHEHRLPLLPLRELLLEALLLEVRVRRFLRDDEEDRELLARHLVGQGDHVLRTVAGPSVVQRETDEVQT